MTTEESDHRERVAKCLLRGNPSDEATGRRAQ